MTRNWEHLDDAPPEKVLRIRATLIERARLEKEAWDLLRCLPTYREAGLGHICAQKWRDAAAALAEFIVETEGIR